MSELLDQNEDVHVRVASSWPPALRTKFGSHLACITIRTPRGASKPATPKLSIVIPTFNTAPWLGEAIRSALSQTETNLEVIVVDDGSEDDSLELALSFTDPRMCVVSQANRGLSAARNTGIFLARANLIGFLDSDDVWFPTKAERHLAAHILSPECDLTFSWSAYLHENGRVTGQLLASRCMRPTARDLTRRNHVGNGSTPVVLRSCFERVGLFDEQLGSCEDLDMWVRIAAQRPSGLLLVPEVLTGYRVREGSLSLTFDTFIQAAGTLRIRFADVVPSLTPEDRQRCYAQLLRIASRKALADRQVELSRKLLVQAIRACPRMIVDDVRAIALLAIHVGTSWLPQSAAFALYRGLSRVASATISHLLACGSLPDAAVLDGRLMCLMDCVSEQSLENNPRLPANVDNCGEMDTLARVTTK